MSAAFAVQSRYVKIQDHYAALRTAEDTGGGGDGQPAGENLHAGDQDCFAEAFYCRDYVWRRMVLVTFVNCRLQITAFMASCECCLAGTLDRFA